ncbi:MAG: terminase large subunit [Rhodospirillaceae bacterium]
MTAYASAVVEGSNGRQVGRLERLACERHLRDLDLGPLRGLFLDIAAAERAIMFFHHLPHLEGEWAAKGERLVLSPWQQFCVGSIFGWKRADGTRRFRFAWEEVARKNGKSTKAAGVGLKLAYDDNEPGAQVYTAATKRDQAKIVFNLMAAMVVRTSLIRRSDVHAASIFVPDSFTKIAPLASDSRTLDGLNIHGAVVDEVHEHKDRKVIDVLGSSYGARRQPLQFEITTAGVFDPEHIAWEHHNHSVEVLEGVVEDDEWFAFIAAIDEGDDWRDERVWEKANPNIDVSVKRDYLRAQCQRAQQVPANQNEFRRKFCNEWVNQAKRWIDLAMWDKCGAPFDPAMLAGRPCLIGLDLSKRIDITAKVLVFPPFEGDPDWYLLPRFYVPEDNIAELSKRRRFDIKRHVADGLVVATPGNIIDYAYIQADVLADADRFKVREVDYDPWNATQLATQLGEAGKGLTLVEIRQGVKSLGEASKEFEALILTGRLRHGGNPVLRWMVNNVTLRFDENENFMPAKRRSFGPIDGVAATINALSRAITGTGPVRSIYETMRLKDLVA